MAANAPMVVFESIARSNIPQREKSAIARWADQVTSGRASQYLEQAGKVGFNAAPRVDATFTALRQNAEGATIGALLGALESSTGGKLDFKAFGFTIPADLTLSALSNLLGIGFAPRASSQSMLNAGSSAMSIYAYRKTKELLDEKKRAPKMAGEPSASSGSGEDPIIAEARNL